MGAERFRWYSDVGMFVEMNRGGVLTYGKRDQCAYCPFSNVPVHLNKLLFTF